MALRTQSASRMRTDAIVGAVVVAAAAIVLGAVFTLADQATSQTTSTYPQDARTIATQAEQRAAHQKALSDFRLAEHEGR